MPRGGNMPEAPVKRRRPASVQPGDVGTPAGVGETVLKTYTIPARTLSRNLKRIEIYAWGFFAADANAKTIRIRFGAVSLAGTIINGQTPANPNGMAWEIKATIIRTATDVQYSVATTRFWAAAATQGQQTRNAALAVDDGAAALIEVTGQNGVAIANDIVCSGVTVDVVDAP